MIAAPGQTFSTLASFLRRLSIATCMDLRLGWPNDRANGGEPVAASGGEATCIRLRRARFTFDATEVSYGRDASSSSPAWTWHKWW
jgi:hypothetical protein